MLLTADPTGIHSWRRFPIEQDRGWPDAAALEEIVTELASRPPLVSVRRCDTLRHQQMGRTSSSPRESATRSG